LRGEKGFLDRGFLPNEDGIGPSNLEAVVVGLSRACSVEPYLCDLLDEIAGVDSIVGSDLPPGTAGWRAY